MYSGFLNGTLLFKTPFFWSAYYMAVGLGGYVEVLADEEWRRHVVCYRGITLGLPDDTSEAKLWATLGRPEVYSVTPEFTDLAVRMENPVWPGHFLRSEETGLEIPLSKQGPSYARLAKYSGDLMIILSNGELAEPKRFPPASDFLYTLKGEDLKGGRYTVEGGREGGTIVSVKFFEEEDAKAQADLWHKIFKEVKVYRGVKSAYTVHAKLPVFKEIDTRKGVRRPTRGVPLGSRLSEPLGDEVPF